MRTTHPFNISHLRNWLCALALLTAQPATALTLKEAVELAMSNDPTFLAAQANLNVSRERAAQAVAGLFPQLTASGQHHRQPTHLHFA